MTPQQKWIMLMDAAYAATDKRTYHALMQKADQVLKENQVAVDHEDAKAA